MTPSLRFRTPVFLAVTALRFALPAFAEEPESPVAVPDSTRFEGAIGLSVGYRPEYSGASRQVVKLSPALFFRYGRFTITNAGLTRLVGPAAASPLTASRSNWGISASVARRF